MALASGKATLYQFLGRHGYGEGLSLEEAIAELIDWWTRQPSLVMHDMGNMLVTMTIGSEKITFDITDMKLLEDLRYEAPSKIYEGLGKVLGISEKDAMRLLDEVDHVSVEVGTIAVPGDPDAFTAEEAYSVEKVLEENRLTFVKNYIEKEGLTDRLVIRTKEGRESLEWISSVGKEMGVSQEELIAAGIPKTLVIEPKKKTRKVKDRQLKFPKLPSHEKGKRYSDEELKIIKDALKKAKGNASLVADELGIPDRTVRNIRQRLKQGPAKIKATRKGAHKVGGEWTDATKDLVTEFAKRPGESAASAARRYGIPDRTARGWVSKKK